MQAERQACGVNGFKPYGGGPPAKRQADSRRLKTAVNVVPARRAVNERKAVQCDRIMH